MDRLSPGDCEVLHQLPVAEVIRYWDAFEKLWKAKGKLSRAMRMLCLSDLYYLMVRVCGRKDMLPCKDRPGFVNNQFAFERCREVEKNPDGYLDLWSREHWKDLADDTPILTANRGWTTHGDLKVGDRVFSPTGGPVSVQAISPQYTTGECYRVAFTDGSSIVAGAGHLWKLRIKSKRRISGTDQRFIEWRYEVVDTETLALMRDRRDVGVAEPLEMPVAQLPVDPYVMGVWLGDGTSSSASLTCAYTDTEIVEKVRAKGVSADERRSSNANSGLYRLDCGIRGKKGTGLTGLLRRIGVLNNKHILPDYMRASIYQRMELLRGLMDTDGHCNTRGTATFINTNQRLAEQVHELACGLGLRAQLNSHFIKVNEEPYRVWRVAFQAHKDRNPFSLKRKADRAIEHYLHRGTRFVSSVEKTPRVPTHCIQVSGGMYLAGRQLIPTHNSSVITFGLTIQDVLKDPEITFGIFSHTRPIAKAFLRQIMRELETNKVLHTCFPDILWGEDIRQAPKWSEDDGIIVKRKSNPNEATIEAWGLVDGQPTSKHFRVLLYDDVVVAGSVTTPEMISKVMQEMERSYNLGTTPGAKRGAGTRWHFNDAYKTISDRLTLKAREHPGKTGGTEDGESVLWDEATHHRKRQEMGPYTYAAQILLNPKADALQGFKRDWLRKYKRIRQESLNWYLLCDAASSKKKGSDFTAMWAVGLGKDGNYYAIPEVRDRLNLKERGDRLFDLHRKYKPKQVRYEKYGLMSDIEHYQARMESENYRFTITEVAGQTSKADRIKRLVPLFEAGRIWLPESHSVTDWQRATHDLVHDFIEEEFYPFPVGLHDDMLDALARIAEPELKLIWPKEEKSEYVPPSFQIQEERTAWMA